MRGEGFIRGEVKYRNLWIFRTHCCFDGYEYLVGGLTNAKNSIHILLAEYDRIKDIEQFRLSDYE